MELLINAPYNILTVTTTNNNKHSYYQNNTKKLIICFVGRIDLCSLQISTTSSHVTTKSSRRLFVQEQFLSIHQSYGLFHLKAHMLGFQA